MSAANSISRRTARASSWMVGARILAKTIDFVTLMILARILAPEDFGLIAIAMVVIQILEAVLELPVSQALVSARRPTRSHLDTAFTLAAARGAIVFFISIALAYPLAHFYDDNRLVPLTCAIALAPAMRSLISVRMATYQRRLRAQPVFLIELVGKVAAFFSSVSVAIATESYWAIAIATIVSPSISAVFSYIVAPYMPRLSLRQWRYFFGILSWTTLTQFFQSMLWNFDKLFLGRVVPGAVLGKFYMADNVSQAPISMLVAPVARPFTAAFSNNRVRHKLGAAYMMAVRSLVFFVAPVMVTIALLSSQIITLLFGPKWFDAAPMLQGFALITILQTASTPLTALCLATHRVAALAARAAIALAIQVPIMVALFNAYGVMGVIGARAIVNTALLIMTFFLVKRITGTTVKAQITSLFDIIPALISASVAAFFLTLFWPDAQSRLVLALEIGLILGVAATVYLGVAIAIWGHRGRPNGAEALIFEIGNNIQRRLFVSSRRLQTPRG